MLLSLVILVVVGCFFSEGHAYFNPGNRVAMTAPEFWLSFAISLLVLIGFVLLAWRFYRPKINKILLTFYLIFLFIGFIGLVCYPGLYDTGDLVYTLSAADKFRYCCSFFIQATSLFLFLDFGPQVIRGTSTLDFVFAFVVADCLVAIGYSYLSEGSLYISLFTEGPRSSYAVPESFTTNRNIYAVLLFYGLISECYLLSKNPKWWRWILAAFLFLNQAILMSKTILTISVAFSIGFLVFRYFLSLKAHPIRNNVVLGIILVFILFLVTLHFSGVAASLMPKVDSLFESFFSLMWTSIPASFSARLYDWAGILKEISKSPMLMLFGFGETNFQMVINYINPTLSVGEAAPLDSAYMSVIAKYGFLGLLLYIGFLVYLITKLVHLWRARRMMSVPYALAFGSFLFSGFLEAHYYLGFQSPNLILLAVVALPILTEDYSVTHQSEQNEAALSYAQSEPQKPLGVQSPEDVLRMSYFICTPIFAVLVGCLRGVSSTIVVTKYSMALVLISLCCVYVFLPIFLSSLRRLRNYGLNPSYVALWILVGGWLLLTAISPLFAHTNYLAIASIVFGALIFLGLLFSSLTVRFSVYCSYAWRYLLVFVFCIGLNLLFESVIVPFSRYLVLVTAVSDIIVWFLCFSLFGRYTDMTPIRERWDRLEKKISREELLRDWRWEARRRKCHSKITR